MLVVLPIGGSRQQTVAYAGRDQKLHRRAQLTQPQEFDLGAAHLSSVGDSPLFENLLHILDLDARAIGFAANGFRQLTFERLLAIAGG